MNRRATLLPAFAAFLMASCAGKAPSQYTYKFTHGKSAILQGKYALTPTSAPESVKRAIAAGNRLQGKPYIYGGGHRRFEDVGYDCSGTTSYVLYHAGFTKQTMASGELMKFGKPGPGKWITVYAKRGHAFSSIADLRLDTGYNGQGEGPRWSTKARPSKGYVMRHPAGY